MTFTPPAPLHPQHRLPSRSPGKPQTFPHYKIRVSTEFSKVHKYLLTPQKQFPQNISSGQQLYNINPRKCDGTVKNEMQFHKVLVRIALATRKQSSHISQEKNFQL